MTTADFFLLFLIISALHGFAFSLILFFSKYGKTKSLLYLNLLLLSISLNNFQSCIYEYLVTDINYFEVPWHFLCAPFLYTFLIHYLGIHKKAVNIIKVIIPIFFTFCLIQLVFAFYYKGTATSAELNYIFEKYRSFEESISLVSSISIFSYAFYILYKKEKLFPNILMFDNLKWIYNFFKLTVIGYLFWIGALIVRFKLNFTGFVFSYYPVRIYITVVIYFLGYQALKYVRLLKERKNIRESIQTNNAKLKEPKSIIPDKKEKLPNNKSIQEFEKIDSFIQTNNKFLKPKYNLQNLSIDVGIGASKLSAIINNNANKTFIDYINGMRIEQSKKLLLDKKYENYTIVSIGLESGFNSKSTFYSVFKKHVGCTPLAYKDKKLS